MGVVMISDTGEVTEFPSRRIHSKGTGQPNMMGKFQTGRDWQTPLGHLSFVEQGSGLAGMVD